MKCNVSPAAFSAVFTLPCDAVDSHIRLAGAVQLKVLLAAFRNLATGIDSEAISDLLSIPKPDVEDALRYWISAGILLELGEKPVVAKAEINQQPKIRVAIRPTREEVARRGAENEEIAFLFREAQTRFGRGLKTSEASSLLWLYDDEGMSAALILMLIEYAVSEQKCSIGFIERTAAEWLKKGVTNIVEAEQCIAQTAMQKTAWRVVESAFGIEKRMPSAKELETADLWINDWGFSREMLRAAYDQCVDATSKFSMPYIRKILEKWHKNGISSPDQIPEYSEKNKKGNYAAYDLSEIEKLLDRD